MEELSITVRLTPEDPTKMAGEPLTPPVKENPETGELEPTGEPAPAPVCCDVVINSQGVQWMSATVPVHEVPAKVAEVVARHLTQVGQLSLDEPPVAE